MIKSDEYLEELVDVAFVERIDVGNIDPNTPPTEVQLDNQVNWQDLVNHTALFRSASENSSGFLLL